MTTCLRSVPATGALVVFLVALACLLTPLPTAAQTCSYTALSSMSPVVTSSTPQYFTFTQGAHYWSVVAVRSSTGDDWDAYLYQDPAGYPDCVSGLLASSAAASGVDFVVADFNYDPVGTYYLKANRWAGSLSGRVEWDQTEGLLQPNAVLTTVTTASVDVARVWDVQLTAGTTYTFTFIPSGATSLRMLLFRNAGGGTLWAPRSAREFEVSSTTTYTAPSTGYYGLVVVNDSPDTEFASYQVGFGDCTTTALSPDVPIITWSAENHYSFDQQHNYWTAVGVRGSSDWDIDVWGSESGSAYPVCFSNLRANSLASPPTVDFVVGDFNYNTAGTHYVRPHLYQDVGSGPGTVQWADGARRIVVNGPCAFSSMGADDVLQVWDVYLTAGTQYWVGFRLGTIPADALKMMLFRNPVAGTYWAGRSAAEITFTFPGTRLYTAPSTGWYGVVVVNDGAGSGTYGPEIWTCTPPASLSANTPVSIPPGYADFQFTQTYPFWAAVGVRSDTLATRRDVSLWTGWVGVPYPACDTGLVSTNQTSLTPRVNLVAGDFNHNSKTTYYIKTSTLCGLQQTGNGRVVWDPTEGTLYPNDPLTVRAAGPDDFLRIWDVQLVAGTQYLITFYPLGPNNKLLLYAPTGGVFWGGRPDATLELNGSLYYTAPSTGYYGVAVVDDDGAPGTYALGFGSCQLPTALTAGVVTSTWSAENYYTFQQTAPYWTAIGVRGTSDWDLRAYGAGAGALYPECFSTPLASSAALPPTVDFVVGDFNHNATGPYYARPYLYLELGSGAGAVEWTSGSNLLTVGAPPVDGATGSTDVLACWDVLLSPSRYYQFVFTHSGSADVKVAVFRNAAGGSYWAGRSAAMREFSSTTTLSTPAGASQYYGVVVVNDNGESGNYSLQVLDIGPVEVEPAAPPRVTELRGVQPNPASGGVHIQFALHEPSAVRFEVLDIAGRLVASLPERDWGAGAWAAPWDGSGSDGPRLHAGLYFVRMLAGNRTIGTARFTLVE